MEVYILPGFTRASFKELKWKISVLDRRRLGYWELLVNLEISSFINVSNLLSVSRASSEESRRTLRIISSSQCCFWNKGFENRSRGCSEPVWKSFPTLKVSRFHGVSGASSNESWRMLWIICWSKWYILNKGFANRSIGYSGTVWKSLAALKVFRFQGVSRASSKES